jgi:2-dehydro-3-deoxygalactonokinase
MSGSSSYADWIAVDWGTTHLRAWAMAEDGTVRAEARSDDGMGRLSRDQFEPALLALVEPWLGAGPMDVFACGMVGSRQGWMEAPYVPVPAKPGALTPVRVATRDARLRVALLPGLNQASPPDVMRGEETQIAGFLAAAPGFDGVLCLPGTHSKWVQISAEEVVSFRTFMTGEMFDLLSGQSVLRHSVSEDGTDPDAFAEAVSETISRPEMLAQRLFSIRAGHLLDGTSGGTGARAAVGLPDRRGTGGRAALLAGPGCGRRGRTRLAEVYATALATQGVTARSSDADPLTRWA